MVQIHVHIHDHYPHTIDRKLDIIMADLTSLKAAADLIVSEVNEAVVALDDLAAKLAAGTLVQADIQAITDTLTGAAGKLDTAANADDPQTPTV